jgi:hypothetical protein
VRPGLPGAPRVQVERRLERSEGLAQGDGQAADLVVAHGLGAAGAAGQAAAGQVGQGVLGERAAGEFAVGVGVVAVAVPQQRAQPRSRT